MKGSILKDSIVKDSITEENEFYRRKISPRVKLEVQADQLRRATTNRAHAAQKAKRLKTLDKFRGSNLAHSVTDDANDSSSTGSDGSTLSDFVSHLDDLESELRQDVEYDPNEDDSL